MSTNFCVGAVGAVGGVEALWLSFFALAHRLRSEDAEDAVGIDVDEDTPMEMSKAVRMLLSSGPISHMMSAAFLWEATRM